MTPLTPEQKQQASMNASGTALLTIINTISVDCANKAGRVAELEIALSEAEAKIAALESKPAD